MAFYRHVLLPKLCDLAMRNKRFRPYRERVIGAAEGRVLEIGVGSGLNLKLYKPAAREIIALEPDPALLRMTAAKAGEAARPVRCLEASAEQIPLEDRSTDTVVTTWTLCSIPDGMRALQDMRRVLKPGGKLLFVEHGLAPEQSVRKWQNRLTPLWSRFSGGCHLNRPITDMIEQAGFGIEQVERGYMPGPRILTFISEGSARPR
ncbi:MAG: class I SAM-dependent methyltransferase [Pseudolabrys sp.]